MSDKVCVVFRIAGAWSLPLRSAPMEPDEADDAKARLSDVFLQGGLPLAFLNSAMLAIEPAPQDITDSDRTALSTAAFELKERLGTYRAFLARCTPATDEFVVTAYKDGIAACEAAIEVVERLAKR